MRVLYIHAHFDDFEFTAAGTFELWRRRLGREFTGKLIVCTDGAAGHQFRTRAETARMRLAEQAASAALGGFEFELLRLPSGKAPREAALQVSTDLLAALWKAIRDFEPDYLLCPPLPTDTLAGVHIDHLVVADAVRRIAYMINVPHAFTPEYPSDERLSVPCKVPVILNVYDGYMFGANAFDLAVDIEETMPLVEQMTWCHQSQVREWLPWVGRHDMEAPASIDDWRVTLRRRFEKKNRELGLDSPHAFEVFTVTAWGDVPTADQLLADFPDAHPGLSNLDALRRKLSLWRGA
jgi:LmbE family N-acetylglucosaminyl deacetylase